VIGPFLGQHNVPYQQDELWLNLEEKTMSHLQVRLFENGESKAGDELLPDCFLRQEMLFAILLSIVLIHCELMPRGKLINNEQKKQASICPMFDHLHV
jgi:hypothetical protein